MSEDFLQNHETLQTLQTDCSELFNYVFLEHEQVMKNLTNFKNEIGVNKSQLLLNNVCGDVCSIFVHFYVLQLTIDKLRINTSV
jgi:hypothetical protein